MSSHLSSVLILLSMSSLMSAGSLSPARANCTSCLGIVAENRSDCRSSGMPRMISLSCSANPISKSRSASSKTTTCTLRRLNSGTSWGGEGGQGIRSQQTYRYVGAWVFCILCISVVFHCLTMFLVYIRVEMSISVQVGCLQLLELVDMIMASRNSPPLNIHGVPSRQSII